LTTICSSLWGHILGDGLKADKPDYQIMQANLMQYLSFIVNDIDAHLYLIAHPRREKSELTLQEKIFPATIGVALSDKIANMFGEVVWCYKKTVRGKDNKETTQFFWSTDDRICVTRQLNLPLSSEIPQDFSLIFK
jgi:hypothetical protein